MKRGFVITIIIGLLIIILLLIFLALFGERPTTNPINYDDCTKIQSDQLQTCCNKWASENNIILQLCMGEWTIKNNQCAWECETIDENTELLQECSRDQENPIECPAGYFCYYDNKCHKSCGIGDGNNCPEETPYCLQKSFCIKDACTVFYGCFAEE